jgi:processing peptidase subunit beta
VRVASEASEGETVSLGVWIDAGSRYETDKNNGAAHFLEQLAFKGTKSRTQKQLETEIENLGGQLKATTSREQTAYTARVFKNDVPKAVEIIADILQNSLLEESAIARERDAILRKAAEASKVHEEVVLDELHSTAFMGTGLGRSILGPDENVKNLTRQDLLDYTNTHYTADRFVISAAGAVDHKQLVDLTNKHFGGLKTGSGEFKLERGLFTGSDKRIRFDSMKEAHIAIAFEGASWNSEFAMPLMLMQTMLGSWNRTSASGRNVGASLASEIAENDLAHSYKTFNTCYKDTGLFGLYMVAPDNKLDDLMHCTLGHLVRLCHNVTDEEVDRAKTQLKASLLIQLDSLPNVADDIARQMLAYDRRMTNAELFARIDAINTDDIKRTANKVINDEDHALAAIGPIYELPDYNWIRRRSYWHRY